MRNRIRSISSVAVAAVACAGLGTSANLVAQVPSSHEAHQADAGPGTRRHFASARKAVMDRAGSRARPPRGSVYASAR